MPRCQRRKRRAWPTSPIQMPGFGLAHLPCRSEATKPIFPQHGYSCLPVMTFAWWTNALCRGVKTHQRTIAEGVQAADGFGERGSWHGVRGGVRVDQSVYRWRLGPITIYPPARIRAICTPSLSLRVQGWWNPEKRQNRGNDERLQGPRAKAGQRAQPPSNRHKTSTKFMCRRDFIRK